MIIICHKINIKWPIWLNIYQMEILATSATHVFLTVNLTALRSYIFFDVWGTFKWQIKPVYSTGILISNFNRLKLLAHPNFHMSRKFIKTSKSYKPCISQYTSSHNTSRPIIYWNQESSGEYMRFVHNVNEFGIIL